MCSLFPEYHSKTTVNWKINNKYSKPLSRNHRPRSKSLSPIQPAFNPTQPQITNYARKFSPNNPTNLPVHHFPNQTGTPAEPRKVDQSLSESKARWTQLYISRSLKRLVIICYTSKTSYAVFIFGPNISTISLSCYWPL